MSRILITSGPTRQYLDPVRFISNASSGKMGCCLAAAALDAGHEVVVISGPVAVEYPSQSKVVHVETTDEMLAACIEQFPACIGMIAAAAPCDFRPARFSENKIKKEEGPLAIELVETPDIVTAISALKTAGQWTVGFALESESLRQRGAEKLKKKNLDLIVCNGISAINSDRNHVDVLAAGGQVVWSGGGTKPDIAAEILKAISSHAFSRSVDP